MSEAVVETPRGGSARAAVAERWFALGVGACTAGVALFLSLRLTAWPPHEDETLALFIGRKRLDGVLGTVLNQRGGAPLHFLFAWAVAHLGGGLVGAAGGVRGLRRRQRSPLRVALGAPRRAARSR